MKNNTNVDSYNKGYENCVETPKKSKIKTLIVGLIVTSLMAVTLSGCGNDVIEDKIEDTFDPETSVSDVVDTTVAQGDITANIKTSMGEITIKLLPEYAPKTVENFVGLAEKGYYNGLIFHRVIDDFMIQGGDPTGTGMGGESLWGKDFEDEFNEKALHLKGAISMANSGPNTNGSQFFIIEGDDVDELALASSKYKYDDITKAAYKEEGGTPWLDGVHSVFGQVTSGMEVVEEISDVKVDASSSKPAKDVVIETVTITKH